MSLPTMMLTYNLCNLNPALLIAPPFEGNVPGPSGAIDGANNDVVQDGVVDACFTPKPPVVG